MCPAVEYVERGHEVARTMENNSSTCSHPELPHRRMLYASNSSPSVFVFGSIMYGCIHIMKDMLEFRDDNNRIRYSTYKHTQTTCLPFHINCGFIGRRLKTTNCSIQLLLTDVAPMRYGVVKRDGELKT